MKPDASNGGESHPLADLEEWDEFLLTRYPAANEKAAFGCRESKAAPS